MQPSLGTSCDYGTTPFFLKTEVKRRVFQASGIFAEFAQALKIISLFAYCNFWLLCKCSPNLHLACEDLRKLACRWTCPMLKLMGEPKLVVTLAVCLWLSHGSQHIGSLPPATTCKLPRDLTSLVLHRELVEKREAVNVLSKHS